MEQQIQHCKQQSRSLLEATLPSLCDEMAFLNSTMIISGSYESKLWRQENRFLQLRKCLRALLEQKSRLKLAHALLEADASAIGDVQRACEHMMGDLAQGIASMEARVAHYEAVQDAVHVQQQSHRAFADATGRLTIKDTDKVLLALHDYLRSASDEDVDDDDDKGEGGGDDGGRRYRGLRRPVGNRPRIVTYAELVRLCRAKLANERSLAQTLAELESEYARVYARKRATQTKLRTVFFGDATANTPLLVPPPVTAAMDATLAAKHALEAAVHRTMDDLATKKRALQFDADIRKRQQAAARHLQQQLLQQQQRQQNN